MPNLGSGSPIQAIDGGEFDVLIVGGGINGCSTAQHLAAAGYSVLLAEKKDFASAASSRSSRILHCGLRYLAPEKSPLEFVLHPKRLQTAINMANRSLRARRELVKTIPERLKPLDMAIPLYKGDAYPGWQVDIGAFFTGLLNIGGPSLHYKRQKPGVAAAEHPLVACLRAPGTLASVFSFRDYQFDWPERITMDAAIAAERLGAEIRNYTEVTGLERLQSGGWQANLTDRLDNSSSAKVSARYLLNLAGVWVDQVNRIASPETPPGPKVVAIKGSHIVVRLPEKFRNFGIAGLNREDEHMFCLPWGDLHYIGPTETVYDGDIEDVRPTKDDIDFLIEETNYMLPGLGVSHDDIEFAWAGARPITYDPNRAKGKRAPAGIIHDLKNDGMSDALAVTWGWLMHHRETARRLVRKVSKKVTPSAPLGTLNYAALPFPDNTNTAALVPECPDITTGVLRHVAQTEAPATLVDIVYRRTNLGWRTKLAPDTVRQAAEAVSDVLDWDDDRIAQETQNLLDYARTQHLQD